MPSIASLILRAPKGRVSKDAPCLCSHVGREPSVRSVPLKEDKGPDHDVLAASRIGGRGRVRTGRVRIAIGAVGSIQAVWKDQRETEPSVTES